MVALAPSQVFLFDDFRLDRPGGGLFRRDHNGAFAPVAVGSRSLDILGVLVAKAGKIVSKEEIIAAVWPGTVVEDSNLTVQISALRRLLDRDRTNGSCIQTLSGRGYRLVSAVTHLPDDTSPAGADAEHAENWTPGPAPLAADRGTGWRRLRYVFGATVSTRYRLAIAAAGAVLLLILAVWALWPTTKPSATPVVAAATSISQPLVAPRLSIVVLPFANHSSDPEQQYFADAITDDLTTDLSQFVNMFVISRGTAFTYRDKPIDTKRIGRELGVRYVLEGSVQRLGSQVRVNAQLVDAETDAHLWAERFERDLGDLFALQNEITSQITKALDLGLLAVEAARPTENPDALNYILRGRAISLRSWTRENYPEAIGLFEQALALDPDSIEAKSSLADALTGRVLNNMTNSKAADLARAEGLVRQALAASPRSYHAHYAKAQLLRAQDRCDEAIPEYETVIALNHNWAGAYASLGACRYFTGSIEEAIPLQERAIRLSPHDPAIGVWYWRIGAVHLLQSRLDEAVPWLEKGRGAMPGHPAHHAWLAAAYALKGESEQAAAELAEARKLSGDDRYSSIARLKAVGYFGVPKIRVLFEDTYLAGLRKAGMPEE